MRNENYIEAERILTDYSTRNGHRRTQERYEILKEVYKFSNRFLFSELLEKLDNKSFSISESTVYNTMRLFVKLGILRCSRINAHSYYETILSRNQCVQTCRVCGKRSVIDAPELANCIDNLPLKRFTVERYTLSVEGICSVCKSIITKQEKKKLKQNKDNK